jgi:hypothetical protein
MKQRLRTLIRSEGWHLVETKRVEFSTYREMRTWCNNTFAQNTWEGKSSSVFDIHMYIGNNYPHPLSPSTIPSLNTNYNFFGILKRPVMRSNVPLSCW